MAEKLESIYEQFENIYSSIDCYVKPPDSPCLSLSDMEGSIYSDEGFSESETDEPLHKYLKDLKNSPLAKEQCQIQNDYLNDVFSEPDDNIEQTQTRSQFHTGNTTFQRYVSLNVAPHSKSKKERKYTSGEDDKHNDDLLNENRLSLSSVETAHHIDQSPLKNLKITDGNHCNETPSKMETETDLNKHSDDSDQVFDSYILQNNNETEESDLNKYSKVIGNYFIIRTCESVSKSNTSLSDTSDCEVESNQETITASNETSSVCSSTLSLPGSNSSFDLDEENNSIDIFNKDSPFGKQLCYFRKKQKSDLFLVKNTTTRLGLKTRRGSYLKWRDENLDDKGQPILRRISDTPKIAVGDKTDIFTKERVTAINVALEWIRNELETMREQDNALARQFIQIRHSIQELKLEKSWEQHKEMLQEAEWEIRETENLKRVSDTPEYHLQEGLAKCYGLTPIKYGSRKFSIL